jgi:probable F420-dependent oxidoreductase
MNVGVIYPQTEFSADPKAITEFAQAVEDLGFDHISAFDHVLGVNPDRPGGWQGQYTYQSVFMEPFVLYSYIAAVTRQISLRTNILILPQRQTALVAKQAATLDVLSGGRLCLGVGLGWNDVEYISLNENFHNRGRRLEEQIQLLRLLWTQPLVKFSGRWHTNPDAGINPLPIQRPIPIWIGGRADRALRRAARFGDGWMATFRTPTDLQPHLDCIMQYLEEAGRAKGGFGVETRIYYEDGNPDRWVQLMHAWQAMGVTHISLSTMGSGFTTPEDHLTAIRHMAGELGIS